jgi:hypothetical protein
MPDDINNLLEDGLLEDALLPAPCRVCGAEYDKYGDGWDGMCPRCADNADNYPIEAAIEAQWPAEAREAMEEERRVTRVGRLNFIATLCSLIILSLFAFAIALALSRH